MRQQDGNLPPPPADEHRFLDEKFRWRAGKYIVAFKRESLQTTLGVVSWFPRAEQKLSNAVDDRESARSPVLAGVYIQPKLDPDAVVCPTDLGKTKAAGFRVTQDESESRLYPYSPNEHQLLGELRRALQPQIQYHPSTHYATGGAIVAATGPTKPRANGYNNREPKQCLYRGLDGTRCSQVITCATVPKRFISHGVTNKSRDEVISCQWEGCFNGVMRVQFWDLQPTTPKKNADIALSILDRLNWRCSINRVLNLALFRETPGHEHLGLKLFGTFHLPNFAELFRAACPLVGQRSRLSDRIGHSKILAQPTA
ncbi:hypothetical protein EDD16DRAFT_1529090 [Pisolithus croceorrhizus]|nr:hypothetical protein EDD16DRAFT_1529090 [Pisolithus croceorrhizus]KAI6129109.1 hypothetical protein EV401DRAFT_2194478 [Pisolithus croceorrhizus]